MTRKVVVFTKNNARIVYTDQPSLYLDQPNAVVDPDLSLVNGVPPHFWSLQGGKIIPLTPDEQERRLGEHARDGVDNEITPIQKKKSPLQLNKYRLYDAGWGFGAGMIIATLITKMGWIPWLQH